MSNDNNGKATQIDQSWRSETVTGECKATQVDEGWRASANGGKKATEIDEGWRAKTANSGRQATQIDEGWRNGAADMLDPTNVMNSATANYFATLDSFKNAVEKLSELKSSTGNIYSVKKMISKDGGESVILLCADTNGHDVVAKVYYEPVNGQGSSISARTRVLEYMETEEGQKYTLTVSEIGSVKFGDSKYYFEIMPFIADGDISNHEAFSFEEICDLTKQMNEALHSIHEFGILHRDISPHNIYKTEKGYVLGDFGVAKITDKRQSNVTRKIVGKDGYTAPELRLGLTDSPAFIYDNKSDYYSLGVTLGSLFEGHFVYDGTDESMRLVSVRTGKLPLTRVDSNREQLENLLNGLCRFDPKYRFAYEDVNCWLIDHNYTGGIVDDEWPKAFHLLGDDYRDEQSMFEGITKDEQHWEETKVMLYDKYIEQFFKSFRTDLARAAQIADELYRAGDGDKGLSVFLKNLFAPGPIVWKGHTFKSLAELGGKMIETKTPTTYIELLQNHCISHWLSNTEGINVDDETMKLVEEIETVSATEPEIACYWFGNSFAPEKKLRICNKKVSTIEKLIEALFTSPNDFYQTDGYKKLLSRVDGADFYGFLFSFGYKEVVDKEWKHLRQCDMFNKTTILISMIDNIAVKANVDPTIIRKFFIDYGPIGLATYTQKLVARTENKVYMALDADGKQILARISGFKAPAIGNIDELFRAYTPLVESIDKLRRNLVENPHCILTGVYESKGVICCNLIGCFAFNIFERVAPLGFNTWIESANGGTNNEFQ